MNRPDDPTDAIRRAVQVAWAAGIEVVEDGLIEIVEVHGTRGQEVIAMFGPELGKISLNEEHEHWRDPAASVRKRYHLRPRWFSTRSVDHIIRHEIGHARHWRRFDPADVDVYWEGRFNDKERAIIREYVSQFASSSAGEFVGEVYAGLVARRSDPATIMEVYSKLRGPEP
jgi:hypothetical protein